MTSIKKTLAILLALAVLSVVVIVPLSAFTGSTVSMPKTFTLVENFENGISKWQGAGTTTTLATSGDYGYGTSGNSLKVELASGSWKGAKIKSSTSNSFKIVNDGIAFWIYLPESIEESVSSGYNFAVIIRVSTSKSGTTTKYEAHVPASDLTAGEHVIAIPWKAFELKDGSVALESGNYITQLEFTTKAASSTGSGVYYLDQIGMYKECTHENTTTTNTATYFKAGVETVVCDDCGKTVSETAADPIIDTPVIFDDAVLNPATNELTVSWTYSEALYKDIEAAANKALTVKFAFDDKEYTVPNTVLYNEGGSVTIEGINADRFNTTLKVNLEFTIGEYTTTALNEVAEYSVAVKDAEGADAYAGLMDAIENAEEAVVAGAGTDSDDFTAGASKIDIKAGTAEIKFVAKQALIDTLLENGNKDKRTVKLVVTIGEESHELTLTKLMSSVTVKISGLSFDQMYGSISANLVIDYAEETGKADITTEAVTFDFVDGVNDSDLAAAAALEALLGE